MAAAFLSAGPYGLPALQGGEVASPGEPHGGDTTVRLSLISILSLVWALLLLPLLVVTG